MYGGIIQIPTTINLTYVIKFGEKKITYQLIIDLKTIIIKKKIKESKSHFKFSV